MVSVFLIVNNAILFSMDPNRQLRCNILERNDHLQLIRTNGHWNIFISVEQFGTHLGYLCVSRID